MKKLIIVSTGIGKRDISVEGIEKINSTNLVVNLSLETNFLSKLVKTKIININERLYKVKDVSKKINIIFRLIKKLFLRYSKISLLFSGNAFFFNVYANELYKRTKKTNIDIEIISGISSFDYVINIITTSINPELKSYIILGLPSHLLSLPDINYVKHDIIIMNFHSINFLTLKEKKKILKVINSMSKRKCYLIKYCPNTSKSIIKKNYIRNIKKFIKEIDNETTIYIPYS